MFPDAVLLMGALFLSKLIIFSLLLYFVSHSMFPAIARTSAKRAQVVYMIAVLYFPGSSPFYFNIQRNPQ